MARRLAGAGLDNELSSQVTRFYIMRISQHTLSKPKALISRVYGVFMLISQHTLSKPKALVS